MARTLRESYLSNKIQIFQLEQNINNCASFTEDDVCRAIRQLQQPHGSTFSDIKRHLCASSKPSPSHLRSLKLATTRGIQSGRIEQNVKGLRYRLNFLNEPEQEEYGGGKRMRKSCGKPRKKRRKKKKKKACGKKKAKKRRKKKKACGGKKKMRRRRSRRRKKKACGSKKKSKPKPRKKACGTKKRKKKKKPKINDLNCLCG